MNDNNNNNKEKEIKKEEKEEKKHIIMKVKPTVLRQLRELAGYTQEQVFKEGIDVSKLESSDKEYIEVNLEILQKLSELYDFGLSVFFLPELPYTLEDINKKFITPIQLGTDYAHRILKLYRRCIYLRDSISDYSDRRPEPNRYSLKDDPKEVAEKEGDSIMLGSIKNNIEEKYCIYVFHISIGDRLVLTDERPYIIAVSRWKDSEMFGVRDILHCYAHVLLRTSSFCMVDNEVERWCNAFADTLSEKYDDVRTTIHMYGKPYLEALNVLNYRLDELSDILDVKISTVEKVIGVLHKF
jgi:transcriptional regulator with XRE-family HTH domain